jgi:hypothetical protein
MSRIKGKVMTQAEEVRELRNWLREDSKTTRDMYRDLHKKIDDCNKENQKEHKELGQRISEIRTDGKVVGSKLLGLSALVSMLVSGVVFVAFQVMAGG